MQQDWCAYRQLHRLATGSRPWDTAARGRPSGLTLAGTSAPDMSAWRGDAATHLSKSSMPWYLAQREQTPCLNGPCGRAWATAACGELGGRHDLDLSLSRPRRPSPTRPCIKPSPAFTRHGVTTEQGGNHAYFGPRQHNQTVDCSARPGGTFRGVAFTDCSACRGGALVTETGMVIPR